ncbi:hypothetical protein KAFR_0F04060 [Kazachstania africana CBS 2517]|uniref:Mitochondrial inner membrane protein COX18 n=1 Tax=Kazachstania africana (strain ATCC 22294 / BCRC 22015 / CBS 2517 / CECT 1963 / NBRC 1671 / NRRL Y-8276) TaxID=1071382 RepID=H2AXA1_KAZAF|nr:hypothetical protein KAFR_0F04060 [Kazachstania africana CBS 2517]CCF59001.1 hypothetical protein KAFR_0F04060 [Kazachstania africana CBS 2517]
MLGRAAHRCAVAQNYANQSVVRHSRRYFTDFQLVADAFTYLHNASGIPWIALIPISTMTLRTLFTLPLSIWQRKRIIKQQELRKLTKSMVPIIRSRLSLTKALSENKLKTFSKEDVAKVLQQQKLSTLTPEQIVFISLRETRKRQKKLFKEHDVQMWKNILLPMVQIPLWCSVSLGLRKLTSLRIHGTTHEWFEQFRYYSMDLVGPWETYPAIIPMLLGIFSLLNVEYNGKMMHRRSTDLVGIKMYEDEYSGASQGISSILNVSRLGCIFMMGVSSQTSVILSLYWISSQVYSLIQNMVMDRLWPYQR